MVYSDQLLFQRVIVSLILLGGMFVEVSLGYIATFYGSAPKVVFILLFILGIYYRQAVLGTVVFLLGIIYDALQGNPLGYSTLQYFVVFIAADWRSVILSSLGLSRLWIEFLAIMLGFALFNFLFFTIYYGSLPPFSAILFQMGMTLLLFFFALVAVDLYRFILFAFRKQT